MSQSGELSLREVGREIYAGRTWIIAFTIITTVACTAWALLSTPIYRSTAVLVPVTPDRSAGSISSSLGQFGGLASLAGINIDSRDSRLEETLAVLRSREFIERFISDHNLLPALFPRIWDSHTQSWKVRESRKPTLWKGYKYFSGQILHIDRDKKTGLVTVSIDWKNRADAAGWANEIVERVNTEMRERALDAAVLSTQYLEKEREVTQLVGTRDAINHLIESEIKQKMLATVTKEYVFRVADRALPADIDDILRPKKLLLVFLGLVGGALLGSMGVLVRLSLGGASNRKAQDLVRGPKEG
jgi:uncharacterized protein involved in exopolysaccharide biosynthesis